MEKTFGVVCSPVSYTHLDVYKRQLPETWVYGYNFETKALLLQWMSRHGEKSKTSVDKH